MIEQRTHTTFLSTGADGLDEVLTGGFVRTGFYLLQGVPGSGKTTLALQFLLKGAANGERGMYLSLTETQADLDRVARSHGWSLDRVAIADLTRSDFNQGSGSEYVLFQPNEVELGETVRQIVDEVEKVRPSRLVFDGLSELRLLSAEPLRYRRQLLALKHYFEEHSITVLALDDNASPMGMPDPESLVGGNIVMEKSLPGYGGARRRLHVSKVRSADFWDGYHDYEIVRGGVRVHPRLIASRHHAAFESRVHGSGVPNLDRMLNGGLTSGTTTLFLGPAGVGKSTCAMTFAAQALLAGHRAAVFTFDEVLATLFLRSEKLCMDGLRAYAQKGQLHAQQIDPAEMSPGSFATQVREVVDGGAKVVVIDSLNGYLSAMPEERFLMTHLHELFAFLNQKGVVTIIVVAQHGLLMTQGSELDVSYLADTVLLLRYFEVDAQIRQAISVFKNRVGPHERSLRELRIDPDGLRVGEPLSGFEGIMTGVARYAGGTRMLDERISADGRP